MKSLLIATLSLIVVQPVFAAIPMLNYDCPMNIQVHSDEGGPVYINGQEARLKVVNDNYYEAKGSGVTISISINPDGTASVSYTGKKGANGICQPAEGD
ncbi:hypothetical protein ACQCLI_08705 [Pseudomonas nitroreducens]|uniref:Lysozyme inhibitor n=1 Tax=Pseudomonas nitroreducens TaxID=46680 RepID=A0A246F9S9_PSENT|nr:MULTISPECIES: hypothetical protein [Pseudomonas]MCG8907840.1 hypothetical protein [Pseudomonas sp. DP-17]MDU4252372.1 hypothetical protein [Pseudomonas sp.]OWP51066.1 hypothetical protein CEG18_09340 [Pseudomonas nitroreducens]